MTDITGHIRESADGLQGRRQPGNQKLAEAIKHAGSRAERRRLEEQLEEQGGTPPVDPEIGRTTSHGW